ncbi:TPR-like protein [Wilcoxina mikolae CBS 423.85]|nr:TPR-like protein [Wilcoxina mikolae CBS 423.85]
MEPNLYRIMSSSTPNAPQNRLGVSSSKPRTFRLSPIPTSVDASRLQEYLNSLECEDRLAPRNILAFSLAPFNSWWLVATVTFRREPHLFEACRPGFAVYFMLPDDLAESSDEIAVDCDFYGITPLYNPPIPREPSYDVIAVSGLSGHAFGSWRSPYASHVMWLRDILHKDFPGFRIFTWGYESDLKHDNTSVSSIMNFSRQLLTAVHAARDGDETAKHRPIIFIGHSLGGLVIKQALVDAAQGRSENDRAILLSCVGLFLFGVPNRGLNNNNLLSLVKENKMAPFIHNLMEGSELLHTLHVAFLRSYKETLKSCYVVSFYETRDTKTVVDTNGVWSRSDPPIRMVTQDSATSFMPEEEVHNQIAIIADHSSLVKFTGRTDTNYINVCSKMREMVAKVPEILQLRKENTADLPVYFMVPFSKNEQFIGRSQKISRLRSKLEGLGSGHRRIALWGLGGVGKTQDVLNFVYEFQGSRVSVFWVHAGSKQRFNQDYRKLSRLVGIPGHDDTKLDIRPIVKEWFEGTSSGNWVMVLDNADNELDFFSNETVAETETEALAQFLPHGTKGSIIVTTRDFAVADRLAGMNTLSKQAMDPEEATILFNQRYPNAAAYDGESISQLLKALQYLPLAIVQVGDFLRLNRLFSPSTYLTHFNSMKDSQKHLLSRSFITDIRRDSNAETVLTTFAITFRQIQQQSRLASYLLNIIACIDCHGIPYELLGSCAVQVNEHEFALNEALSKLINFSLLTASAEFIPHDRKHMSNRAYEMHSLVHASIQAFQSQEDKNSALEYAAKALAKILPNGDFHNHAVWRIYLPHVSTLAMESKEQRQSVSMARIHFLLAWYLNQVGNYSEALPSARTALVDYADLLGEEHPETLSSMHTLAMTYHYLGLLEQARVLGEQVVETSQRVLGPEHPETLASMSNLAVTYERQGRWTDAEQLLVHVVETRKRVLGPEHQNVLASINNLAITYKSQGRWTEAVQLLVHLIEMRKQVLGPEHPDTLTSMSILATTYQRQGRWADAEQLGVHVMETTKRVLGPEHPATLAFMGHLATTYQKQGRWTDAEQLGVHVMETTKRVLGPEHPDTLISMGDLATTYQSQGRWADAEQLGVHVMETKKRVLGKEHPETLTTMHNLACTYHAQGRIGEAIALMSSTVALQDRILGRQHPNTNGSVHKLEIWRNQAAM